MFLYIQLPLRAPLPVPIEWPMAQALPTRRGVAEPRHRADGHGGRATPPLSRAAQGGRLEKGEAGPPFTGAAAGGPRG